MKLKIITPHNSFRAAMLFAAVFLLAYTGCKKNTVKPAVTTAAKSTDYAAISRQVALTLYKSLTGQYGGAGISTGFISPYSMKGSKRTAFDITPLCGLVTDSNYNYTLHTDSGQFMDVATTYWGSVGFTYTCSGTSVNGYIVNQSANSSQADFMSDQNTTSSQQTDTVVALDATYKVVSLNGTLAAQDRYTLVGAEEDSSLNATYKLSNLRIEFTSGTSVITSGSSTFYISDSPLHSTNLPFTPPPPISGTIEFLGNNEAKITIDPGQVFHVNLLTGVITAG